ncbi:MAG: peptidylprolyl isomerase [Myxococcales bacterium]|nr:peptidylprolyl isomerase [Myxococcales bacterium]
MALFSNKKVLKTIQPLEAARTVRATLETSMGAIELRLHVDKAPKTVTNFLQLAEGATPSTNPITKQQESRPYFDGLLFHRVIPGFMIQGGCPKGDGTGGPGWEFTDEFHPTLRHDKAGTLSMANAGPNTNGSQFFVTCAPTPFLDNKHTVFGEVANQASLDVVLAIAAVGRNREDRPHQPVTIRSVRVVRE